jgi:hypothetical protein
LCTVQGQNKARSVLCLRFCQQALWSMVTRADVSSYCPVRVRQETEICQRWQGVGRNKFYSMNQSASCCLKYRQMVETAQPSCRDSAPSLSRRLFRYVGKIWERSPVPLLPAKSHRINRPPVLVRSHNPKVVGSNPTPATMLDGDFSCSAFRCFSLTAGENQVR